VSACSLVTTVSIVTQRQYSVWQIQNAFSRRNIWRVNILSYVSSLHKHFTYCGFILIYS
jgi:hypothetical protein